MSCCAPRAMPRRTIWARSTSSARAGSRCGRRGATARTRIWAWPFRAFPNFFMLYGPNTNVGSNSVIFMLEAQARYIVRALKYMRRKRKSYVAVRPADDGGLHRQDRRVDGGHRVAYPVQQLLPRRQRPGGHPVAAQRARVLGDDAPVPAARTTPSTRRATSAPSRQRHAQRRAGDRVVLEDRLDPALRHFAAARTDLSPSVLGVVRDSLNQRRCETARDVNTVGVEIENREARSIPVRIYRGGPAPAPAVIYCHAGAFVLGNLDTDHRAVCGVRATRPLHRDLRRLPVGAGRSVSGRP